MASILKVENLRYKDILKDVTFSLEEKTFNILVGNNGSGKTTLVKSIRGLSKYSGNIIIENQNLENNIDLNKKIGFFVNNDYLLEKSIYEELLSFLINLDFDVETAKTRIYNITKKLGINNILYKCQSDLNNQEKTLLSFIFSIIHDPKILIIDNNLDSVHETYKNKILNYIKSKKKLSVLFITNNPNYFNLADHFLFLKDGKLVSSCTIDEILKNEKLFIKAGAQLPFLYELSSKLISYGLLDDIELNIEEMVNKIWK